MKTMGDNNGLFDIDALLREQTSSDLARKFDSELLKSMRDGLDELEAIVTGSDDLHGQKPVTKSNDATPGSAGMFAGLGVDLKNAGLTIRRFTGGVDARKTDGLDELDAIVNGNNEEEEDHEG